MQQFMGEMKRKDIKKERIKLFFQSIYGCPAIIFMLWFALNVSSLASKHLDYQVTYPLAILAIGSVLFLIHLCLRYICHKMVGRWYIIPAIYILTGIITLFIGSITPCC